MKRLHGDTVDYILRDASGTELQRIVRRQNSGASPIILSIETSLYGSSRLGTYVFSPNPGNDSTERRTNAKTTYELTDHLGNVRATVSDQKTYTAITGGYSLAANVLSASDLYPYGMAINSRSFAAGTYRYGFNTQEKSPEILADYTTALYWEYDARTGRRWNLDPKPHFGYSEYATLGSNPILVVDPNGDYFFGLFGSTAAERRETRAKNFADKVGGFMKKNDAGTIMVVFKDRNGVTCFSWGLGRLSE